MTYSRRVSSNCSSQSAQKNLGGPSTPNTVGTIELLVTLLKSVSHSRSASCDWLRKEIILDLDETAEVGHVTVQEADESDSEIDHAAVLEGS